MEPGRHKLHYNLISEVMYHHVHRDQPWYSVRGKLSRVNTRRQGSLGDILEEDYNGKEWGNNSIRLPESFRKEVKGHVFAQCLSVDRFLSTVYCKNF